MSVIIVTGCGGLVGREACEYFLHQNYDVIGIDNDLRAFLFGNEASVQSNLDALKDHPNFQLKSIDIRSEIDVNAIFQTYGSSIKAVIHTAAQPSHDWACKAPLTDFDVNARATLLLLEATRLHAASDVVFIFTSTNKVYGDRINSFSYLELGSRYAIDSAAHPTEYQYGIDETFPLDRTTHSLFGCSKAAADLYVQEYSNYYGMNTVVLRGGCLTGPNHKGAKLHGFLNYLVKCNVEQIPYEIIGHKGKQVRDNIHVYDLINAFDCIINNPVSGVYNIGGGMKSNCSVLEANAFIESQTNIITNLSYNDTQRIGDHIWWISDIRKFESMYPQWNMKYTILTIIKDIINGYNN